MYGCEYSPASLVTAKRVSENRLYDKVKPTLIIQLETWLMLRPVAAHNCFFSSSLG